MYVSIEPIESNMRYFGIPILIGIGMALLISLVVIYLFATKRNFKAIAIMVVSMLVVPIIVIAFNITFPAYTLEDSVVEKINQEQGVEATVSDDGAIDVLRNGKRCSYSLDVINKPTAESSGMVRLDGDPECLPSHWHDDEHNHDSVDMHEHEGT